MTKLGEGLSNWRNRNTPDGLQRRIGKLDEEIDLSERWLGMMRERPIPHPTYGMAVGLLANDIRNRSDKRIKLQTKLENRNRQGQFQIQGSRSGRRYGQEMQYADPNWKPPKRGQEMLHAEPDWKPPRL